MLQPEKAYAPIDVTLSPIVTEVKLTQEKNASTPILVTLYVVPLLVTIEGISTDVAEELQS